MWHLPLSLRKKRTRRKSPRKKKSGWTTRRILQGITDGQIVEIHLLSQKDLHQGLSGQGTETLRLAAAAPQNPGDLIETTGHHNEIAIEHVQGGRRSIAPEANTNGLGV